MESVFNLEGNSLAQVALFGMNDGVIAGCKVFRIEHAGKLSPSLDGFGLATQNLADISTPSNGISGYIPAISCFAGRNKSLQHVLVASVGRRSRMRFRLFNMQIGKGGLKIENFAVG